MCVSSETGLGLNAIFVDHPEAAKAIMSGVIVAEQLVSLMIR